MKAITVEDPSGPAILHERPVPKPKPGYLLVKTAAVALNPADGIILDFKFATPGSLMGCDYAGTVVEVGEGVERPFKKGDRVCGATRSADPNNPDMGAFAEYVVVKADVQLHIPAEMSFEEAAALGVTVLTTGRCLFDKFDIPYPTISENGDVNTAQQPQRQLLVYGGSSAMGTMVIQFAKLANFYVLTTSSHHNADTVQSYGPDVVVDHYSTEAPAEILNAIAKSNLNEKIGRLTRCVDCIGIPQSAEFCARILTPKVSEPNPSSDGAEIVYSVLSPLTPELPGIQTVKTLGYSFLGEAYEAFGQKFPAVPEDFAAAKQFAIVAEKLLAKGLIKSHPLDVRDGGLEGVVKEGMDDIRNKKVSGKKIVYRL